MPSPKPMPPLMLTTDTTDTVWDTADTMAATTADTGREKPKLRPNPRLMPLPMPGTDTTVIPDTDTTDADGVDTTVDTTVSVPTVTTVATGGKRQSASPLSFRTPFFRTYEHLGSKIIFSPRNYSLNWL